MPDVRQNPMFLDDFNRANEDPLSSGGRWTITPSFNKLVLKDQVATHGSGVGSGDMYWNDASFDGDAAESWGYQFGGGASGIAWAVDLWTSAGSGYRFRYERAATNIRWRIYGPSGIIDDTGEMSSIGTYTNGLGILLIRRNGSSVEGWAAAQADPTTWTQWCSATDTSVTTDLHPGLGCTDNSASQILGWQSFGGGAYPEWMPEFIRRPWRYQGAVIDSQLSEPL